MYDNVFYITFARYCIKPIIILLVKMEEYPELTTIFETIILQAGALDIAIAEFRRMIADDPELKSKYKEWCEENGYSERHGFEDYAEDFINSREEIWDSLTDYDAEEH